MSPSLSNHTALRKVCAIFVVASFALSPLPASGRESEPATAGSLRNQNMGAAMMAMPLVAPLFLEDQTFSSTLVIVNASYESTFATVILRNLSGNTIFQTQVPLPPASQTQLPVGNLLRQAKSSERKGSIVVEQSPDLTGMAVLAQLSITRTGSRLSFIDEELSMPDSAMGSAILRGVAHGNSKSSLVAIASLAQTTQRVRIDCFSDSGMKSSSVELAPDATVMTEPCGNFHSNGEFMDSNSGEGENSDASDAIGVQLTSDGAPGHFAAFGITQNRNKREVSFNSVPFDDPKMAHSATTVYSGVAVGPTTLLNGATYKPSLSIANFSSQTRHVKVEFARTSGGADASTPTRVTVKEINIAAQRAVSIDFESLQGDPGMRNAFIVGSDAQPGELISGIVSKASEIESPVALLGKDAQAPENAGVHPWSIEGQNESDVLLFNHSGTEQVIMVTLANGAALWQKLIQLHSFETKRLNIREIVELGLPDDSKRKWPAQLSNGEITWSSQAGSTTGRLLVSNRIIGMARSFSCAAYNVLCGASISPTTAKVPVGGTSSFWGGYSSCIGYNTGSCSGPSGGGVSANYSWPSGGGVVDVSGCGNSASCTGRGQNTGSGQVQFTAYTSSPGYCVFSAYSNVTGFNVQITKADIVANQITVSMIPTGLSGTLTLTANGPSINKQLYSGVQSGGTTTFPFSRTTLPVGSYTYVKATWNVSGSGTVSATQSVSFNVLGVYRHSQYNSPQESYCTGTASQGWFVNINNCTFTPTTFKSDFISQVGINGSGIAQNGQKVQRTHQCSNYPSGANADNALAAVTTINGSCLQPVVADQTVATYPYPPDNTASWNCSDSIELVTSSDANLAQKTVKDSCPACSGDFRGAAGHIDNYTSAPYCSGHDVGDLPGVNYLTIRLRY